MIDVIERLQKAETMPLDADGKTQLWETLQDARAEIARLREAIRRLADQDATLSACDGNVTVDIDGSLTPEEREAIEWAATAEWGNNPHASTLLGLLERTKGD